MSQVRSNQYECWAGARNTECGRYHLLVYSVQRAVTHTTCLVLLQDIFCRRPFNLALRRSRMARFVEVNMGISPRNVRSEGVAPCK